jgi:hypothetical protein
VHENLTGFDVLPIVFVASHAASLHSRRFVIAR